MSYALGTGPAISVGQAARRDPVLAFSSVMASDLLKRSARTQSPGRRLGWLRRELNKAQPGLGSQAEGKVKELVRRGVPANQAMFDGLRLTIANQVATSMDKLASQHSVDGLGSTAGDISAVFCGILGIGTGAGAIATSFKNPAGSAAVGEAGAAAMQSAGCNEGALAAQARIAEANARAAEAAAAMSSEKSSGNMGLYIGLGLGGLALVGLGIVVLKKK